MANAKRDENRVTTMVGLSSADGVTVVPIQIDSVTGRVLLSQQASGTHSSVTNRSVAYRDGNHVPVMLATSSSDGALLMPVVEGDNLRINNS